MKLCFSYISWYLTLCQTLAHLWCLCQILLLGQFLHNLASSLYFLIVSQKFHIFVLLCALCKHEIGRNENMLHCIYSTCNRATPKKSHNKKKKGKKKTWNTYLRENKSIYDNCKTTRHKHVSVMCENIKRNQKRLKRSCDSYYIFCQTFDACTL